MSCFRVSLESLTAILSLPGIAIKYEPRPANDMSAAGRSNHSNVGRGCRHVERAVALARLRRGAKKECATCPWMGKTGGTRAGGGGESAECGRECGESYVASTGGISSPSRKPTRARVRYGCCNLRTAFDSIWRTRSRVTEKILPTS